MIERKAEKTLKRLASQFPVVAVTGPRQSGKTTLAKMVFPEKKYISFDDKNMREIAKSSPSDFLLAFPDGAVFDEAQKVPEIFDAIKLNVDSQGYYPGKYILTGSSQFRLKENIAESLAGRAGVLNLLPFSIGELEAAGKLGNTAYDTMLKGFYPPLYDDAKHFLPEDWFESYINTYLDMDVKDWINPSNISVFRKFISFCAIYSGQMLNMESLSRELGVSSVTVKSWLSVLEASYIIHFVYPDTNNLGRTLVKTPKIYFVDPGLMCRLLRLNNTEEMILSRYKGAVIETAAVSELLKSCFNEGKKAELTYFRDKNGFEVDFIADWKHTCAIEIKSESYSENKLSSNVRKYLEMRGEETSGAVFYLGDISCNIAGVDYVSWRDWGKFYTKFA